MQVINIIRQENINYNIQRNENKKIFYLFLELGTSSGRMSVERNLCKPNPLLEAKC